VQRLIAGRHRDVVVARWQDLDAWGARAHDHPTGIVAIVGLDPVLLSREYITTEVCTRLVERRAD
jgi:hypothetical protein